MNQILTATPKNLSLVGQYYYHSVICEDNTPFISPIIKKEDEIPNYFDNRDIQEWMIQNKSKITLNISYAIYQCFIKAFESIIQYSIHTEKAINPLSNCIHQRLIEKEQIAIDTISFDIIRKIGEEALKDFLIIQYILDERYPISKSIH